jgi:hypothetical protein
VASKHQNGPSGEGDSAKPSQPVAARRRLLLSTIVCWQSVLFVGWGRPPAAAPTFREGMNVLLARTKEIQKYHIVSFAGFVNAQQNEIFGNAILGGRTANGLPQKHKSLDCMLRIIVVPRNPIVIKEGEKLVPFF